MTKLRKVGNKLCRDGAKIQTVECGCGPNEPGIDCSWQVGPPGIGQAWDCCGVRGGTTAPYAAFRNIDHPDNPDGRFEITRRLAAAAGVEFTFFDERPPALGGDRGDEPTNPTLAVESWGNAQFMDPNPTTCDTGFVTHWPRSNEDKWPLMVVPIPGVQEWTKPDLLNFNDFNYRKRHGISFEIEGQINSSVTNEWSLNVAVQAWQQRQTKRADEEWSPWYELAEDWQNGPIWEVIARLPVQVIGTGFPVEGSDLGSITFDTFPQINEPLFGLERNGTISPSIVNWLGLFGGVEVLWDYTEVHEFIFNQYGAIKTGRFYGNGSLKQFFCPCNIGTQSITDPRILDRLNRQANGGGCAGCGDGNNF